MHLFFRRSAWHRLVGIVLRGRFRVADDATAAPRPDDAPQVHALGVDPDRIALIGNGPACGWGVRSHDLAMPGHLARALSAATGRGADVDLIADPDVTAATAPTLLGSRRLRQYDAVVVVLGVRDAIRMTSVRSWRESVSALLDTIEDATVESTPLVVMGIQPPSSVQLFHLAPGGAADRQADRLNAATRALLEGRRRASFVPAPELATPVEGDARITSGARFRPWAAVQAAALAPLLDANVLAGRSARGERNRPQGDEERLEAIRGLGLLDTPREQRFDDIVERARILLGTDGAAFSLVDDRRQWHKAVAGAELTELPLAASFCAQTIKSGVALVVPDAWSDDRFVSHPAIRFYAGHPVETADGVRIGALCVVDAEPRSADSVDLVLLRELALAVQRELAATPSAPQPTP
ncbi:GAF domain-containing protein [Frigoribacterium sp. 2-23]|uniref:GAF domain-containing protein n=1 Tax=Frigoribacterium sp. 2-23 TaxID=3415006 RepID=UPI003C6EC640